MLVTQQRLARPKLKRALRGVRKLYKGSIRSFSCDQVAKVALSTTVQAGGSSPAARALPKPALCVRASMDSAKASAAPKKSVAVIGAGIIGASIAKNLSSQNCDVTVLEIHSKPAQEATGKSWAWLNANRKEPAHYKELNARSMREWQKLPGLAEFPGTLYLGDQRDNDPRYPSQKLTQAEALERQPGLSAEAAAGGAVLYAQEGFASAPDATEAFLREAQSNGAHVHYSQEAIDFTTDADNQLTGVRTAHQEYPADVVVLASGIKTPALASKLGVQVPLENKPGTVNILSGKLPPLLKHILVTDEAFLMQRKDGRVLISFYKGVHANPSALNVPEEPSPEQFAKVGKEALEQALLIFPELKQASEAPQVIVGRYPYPVDAMPILGPTKAHPNLYIATMHSGATLGPIVGQLVAQEISQGLQLEDLDPYRPHRDFGDLSHLY
ncbi:hypothetical protein WJX73_000671 [Symbiochloris irregularis]|uniref:FAD dependent oxidoreductase domain-containing protein n=1 Tax=Symbiochloris irregularis TaxID=706552 RepID=A0AAW1NS99_9CHLO